MSFTEGATLLKDVWDVRVVEKEVLWLVRGGGGLFCVVGVGGVSVSASVRQASAVAHASLCGGSGGREAWSSADMEDFNAPSRERS